jgi:hypothetical protein
MYLNFVVTDSVIKNQLEPPVCELKLLGGAKNVCIKRKRISGTCCDQEGFFCDLLTALKVCLDM